MGTDVVAKSVTSQPILEGYIYPQDDAVLVKMPPEAATAKPRVFIFPVSFRVTETWSSWLAPKQLDYGEFPQSVNKLGFFTAPDRSALPNAPRVRWRTESIAPYNRSRTNGKVERYLEIPEC